MRAFLDIEGLAFEVWNWDVDASCLLAQFGDLQSGLKKLKEITGVPDGI